MIQEKRGQTKAFMLTLAMRKKQCKEDIWTCADVVLLGCYLIIKTKDLNPIFISTEAESQVTPDTLPERAGELDLNPCKYAQFRCMLSL